MSMVKFSLVALNFGYDFVLEVHFLGHPVYVSYLSEDIFSITSHVNNTYYEAGCSLLVFIGISTEEIGRSCSMAVKVALSDGNL